MQAYSPLEQDFFRYDFQRYDGGGNARAINGGSRRLPKVLICWMRGNLYKEI
jgi:hypothetical protein